MPRLRPWFPIIFGAVLVGGATGFVGACTSFTGDASVVAEGGAAGDAGTDGDHSDDGGASDSMADASSPDGSTSVYRSLVLADGPLAYWRMGLKTGLIIPDETGRGNDLFLQGTSVSSTTLGEPGAIADDDDTAVRFDGLGGRAKAKNPRAFDFPNLVPFTVELWMKRHDIDGGALFQYLVGHVQGSANDRTGFAIWVVPNDQGSGVPTQAGFEYDRYDGGDQSVYGTLVPAEQWAHYAAVFENQQITLYVDGTPSSMQTVAGPLTLNMADMVIGAAAANGDDALPATIDEVAIYDKALPVATILAHASHKRP